MFAQDDFTMYLWDPSQGTKPVARLLGHQKAINHVTFSPDGTRIFLSNVNGDIKVFEVADGTVSPLFSIPLPPANID